MIATRKEIKRKIPFGTDPHVVLFDTNLSDSAKITYLMLRTRSGTKGKCWVSEKRIAEDRGKDVRTIERHIAELRDAKLISMRRRRGSGIKEILPIEDVYEECYVPFTESPRKPVENPGPRPDKNDGSYCEHSVPRPDKNDGFRPDKNVGCLYNKKRGKNKSTNPTGLSDSELPLSEEAFSPGPLFAENGEQNSTDSLSLVQANTPHGGTEEDVRKTREEQKRDALARKTGGKKEVSKKIVQEDAYADPQAVEARKGNAAKKKKGKPVQVLVFSLWPVWKCVMRSRFGVDIPGDRPLGSNFGHLRNVIQFVSKDMYRAEQLIHKLMEEWDTLKVVNTLAGSKLHPDLHLLDTFKEQLIGMLDTGKGFKDTQRAQDLSAESNTGKNRSKGTLKRQGALDSVEAFNKASEERRKRGT